MKYPLMLTDKSGIYYTTMCVDAPTWDDAIAIVDAKRQELVESLDWFFVDDDGGCGVFVPTYIAKQRINVSRLTIQADTQQHLFPGVEAEKVII